MCNVTLLSLLTHFQSVNFQLKNDQTYSLGQLDVCLRQSRLEIGQSVCSGLLPSDTKLHKARGSLPLEVNVKIFQLGTTF